MQPLRRVVIAVASYSEGKKKREARLEVVLPKHPASSIQTNIAQ
jgi:hypothetical protein